MLPSLSIRQVPLLRLAIMIMIGMTVSRLLLDHPDIVMAAAVLLLIVGILSLLYHSVSPALKSLIVHVLGICAGFILYTSHVYLSAISISDIASLSTSKLRFYEIENINTNPDYTTLFTRYLGNKESTSNKGIGVVISVKNGSDSINYKRGAIVSSSSKVRPVKSRPTPTGFDYGQYLRDQGYQLQFFTNATYLSAHGTSLYPWWKKVRYHIRNKFLSIIDQELDPTTANITKALVLGDRSGLDDESRVTYADSGIIHILAVSGLHVGIIAWLLFEFIDRSLWWLSQHHWLKTSLIIVSLLLFAELSGGAAPVWRAVVMSSIYLVAKTLGRSTNSMNLLGLAAIIILLFRPADLFTVSFQLSFAAVSGILLFSPWLFKIYTPQHKHLKKGWTIIVLGICAQLGTLPLTLYYFHQFPLLSPIAGLIAIPAAGVILASGIALIISHLLLPSISMVWSYVLKLMVILLNGTASFIALLPGSLVTDIWITPISAIFILSAIISAACWLYLQDRRFYKIAMIALALTFISHISWREYIYFTPQTITYSEVPLAVDIIIRGNCYHYNEDSERTVSDYLTNDVRSKYQTDSIIIIDRSFMDQLKLSN